MKRVVVLDESVELVALEDENGTLGFRPEELHNLRIWVNGIPVVITLGGPDAETHRLLEE